MLPGTSEATSHFLCPAPGALGDWVLLGECGQDQLQASLPPAVCMRQQLLGSHIAPSMVL